MRSSLVLLVLLAACAPSSRSDQPAPALDYAHEVAWPERPPATLPAAGRLLVTNNFDDTISFFDAALVGQPQLPELARVPIGTNPVEIEAPHHAAIAAAGDVYYVPLSNSTPGLGTGPHASHGAGTVDGRVLKIDARTNRVLGATRVDPNPGDIVLSPDGTTVAVSHFDLVRIALAQKGEVPSPDARVFLIDAQSMEVKARVTTCAAPHGMAFSADGQRLYLACSSDEVAVVQLSAPDYPVTRVKVASNAGDAFRQLHQPYALAVSPRTGDVFISCLKSQQLRLLKADTLTIDEARTRTLFGSPFLAAFSADGSSLYVPTQGDDVVTELDAATGALRRGFSLPRSACANVHQVMPAKDPRYLLVLCEGYRVTPGTLVVLDATTGATVSVTTVGAYPDYLTWARSP